MGVRGEMGSFLKEDQRGLEEGGRAENRGGGMSVSPPHPLQRLKEVAKFTGCHNGHLPMLAL